MDADDLTPKRRDRPLDLVRREDLDPLSQAELAERIAALEAEIARSKARLNAAATHKSAADALFRRG